MKRFVAAVVGLSLVAVAGTVVLMAADKDAPPGGPALAPGPAGPIVPPPGGELIDEGRQLLNRGENRAAVEALNQALELFRAGDDMAGQAHAHLGLGRAEHFTGQAAAARDHYARAVALYREAGSPADHARALMAMGDLEMDTFQWEAAAEFFREGRRVWALTPEPKFDFHVLLKLESVAAMPEGEDAARAVLDQAALIFENIGDADGVGDVFMHRGDLQQNLGDVHGALSEYTMASIQYRAAGNPTREALASVRAAEFEVLEGHNAEAAMRLDQADTIFAVLADTIGQAMADTVRGNLARLLPGHANALLKLGQIEAQMGNAPAAQAALEAALEIHDEGGDPGGKSATHLFLGRMAAVAGDLAIARQNFLAAADLAGQAGDTLGQARAHLELAALSATEGDRVAAQRYYDGAQERFAAAQVLMGAVLVDIGRADLAQVSPAASAAYRRAEGALAALDDPVAEANRFLGLPPVSRIFLVDELDEELGGDEPDLGAAARLTAAREANLAAYPDHNLEGRQLVADTLMRIAAGLAAAN
jgi:tetratricopeptide (TPR) repeat protein